MKKIISVFSILFTMILVLIISLVTTRATSDVINLASPDLSDTEYLGDGEYELFNQFGVNLKYNVYNGYYTLNGTSSTVFAYSLFTIEQSTQYTVSYIAVSGSLSGGTFGFYVNVPYYYLFNQNNQNVNKNLTFTTTTQNLFRLEMIDGRTFNDYKFKLQLEKGSIVTAYQTPIGALQQHNLLENERAYNTGYDYGYGDASILGYPPNLADWYSDLLYSNYYHMTTGNVLLDTHRKGVTVIVPDFNNIITSAGQGTEQRIVFYDSDNNEISSSSVFGRLTGRFDYSIPMNAYSFSYYVLVQGPLANNYVEEWNKVAFVGYKDLLVTYGQSWQAGYDEGYEYGKDDGHNLGYNEGRDYGYELGKIEAVELYKDEWYNHGKSIGYAEGLDDNVANGGFIMILSSAFIGVSTLLGIELLPNITLGMIVAVPLVFGILFFILGKRKD